MKLTQQDKARLLNIDARTLRNWRNNKPKLYEIIQKGFAYEELLNELEKKIKEVRELEDKYRS